MKGRVVLGALLLALGPQIGIAKPEQAGSATAVQTHTTGVLPGQAERTILLEDEVYRNETVSTDGSGIAQLLFLDNSALTISPNSEVVIDEFVYNPKTGVGNLVVRMTKGFMRFVGGRISKQNEVQVVTPTATVGIRGGIASVRVRDTGETVAILGFGALSVRTEQGAVDVQRPGFKVTAASADAAPSEPVQASTAELAESVTATASGEGTAPESSPGGDAAAAPPDKEEVATALQESGLGEVNSGSETVTEAAAPSGIVTVVEETAGDAEQVGTDTQSEVAAMEQVGALSGRLLLGNTPSSIGIEVLDEDNRLAIQGPRQDLRITADPAGSGVVVSFAEETDIESVQLPGPAASDRPDAALGGLIRFSVQSMETSLGMVDGYGYASPEGDFYYYDLQADGREMIIVVGEADDPNWQGAGLLRNYRLLPDEDFSTRIPFSDALFSRTDEGQAFVSDLYMLEQTEGRVGDTGTGRSVFLQYSVLVRGEGDTQRSFLSVNAGIAGPAVPAFNALRRGSARTRSTAGMHSYDGFIGTLDAPGPTYGGRENLLFGPGSGTDTSRDWFTFLNRQFEEEDGVVPIETFGETWHVAQRTEPPVGGTGRTSRELRMFSAGLDWQGSSYDGVPGELYSDDDDSNTGIDMSFDAARSTLDVRMVLDAGFGTTPIAPPFDPVNSVFIHDDLYVAVSGGGDDYLNAAGEQMYLIGDVGAIFRDDARTAEQTALSGLGLSADEYCECAFLEWGFWGGSYAETESDELIAMHMGTWVAGEIPGSAELPTSGEASYAGHAVGDVARTDIAGVTHRYLAAGGFSMDWDFATRTGTANIDNFDGRSFSGSMADDAEAGAQLPSFDGGLSGSGISDGLLQGSFYSSPDDRFAGVGGTFGVDSDNYRAVGTFAGER